MAQTQVLLQRQTGGSPGTAPVMVDSYLIYQIYGSRIGDRSLSILGGKGIGDVITGAQVDTLLDSDYDVVMVTPDGFVPNPVIPPQSQVKVFHITTSAVTNVTAVDANITAALISVTNSGTNWDLSIKDRDTPAHNVIPPYVLNQPGSSSDLIGKAFAPPVPIFMKGGIDIVTTGASTGIVDVWLWYF